MSKKKSSKREMDRKIKTVKLRSGMVKNLDEIKQLPVHTWEWQDLPENIRKLYVEDRPWELPGTCGEPAAGDPIQYHKLTMISRDETREIEFFNLAITMGYYDNTEELRRLFRCLIQLEEVTREN